MKLSTLICCLFLILSSNSGTAQEDLITLRNSGLEDEPQYGKAPIGWYNCGSPGESPPDIHPIPESDFEVIQSPYEGRTYMGLVVRDNQTVEAVGQRLKTPLKKDQCYEIGMMLCRSKSYKSKSRKTDKLVNYNMPVKIKLWAGKDYGDKKELLSSSSPVQSTAWKEYKFRFQPTQSYTYFTIEAAYGTANVDFYNGNILIDDISAIQQISCGDETAIAATPPPVVEKPIINKPKPKPTPVSKPKPTPTPSPKLTKLGESKLEVGKTIALHRLYFEADKAAVTEESYPVLEELYAFLKEKKNLKIEIGGHTNSTPPHDYCDKLSTERAKFVTNYLEKKGIASSRLTYKGYGKRKPLVTNKTVYGRKRNQRVEVKILQVK